MKRTITILAALTIAVMMVTSARAYSVDLSNPQNYGGQSGSTASHVISASGSTLSLSGNVWALITLDSLFTVENNSTLTFTYSSTEMPEIAAVLFDTNTSFTHNPDQYHAFCFGGTDGFPSAGYTHPTPYTAGEGEVTYTFSLASVLGVGNTYNYLILVSDDDLGGPLSNAVFSNVSLSATPIPGAIWLLGSGLAGLLGFRRKMRS